MKKKPAPRTRQTQSVRCPKCDCASRVLRTKLDADVVRRERQCLKCNKRFLTLEKIQ